jgi:hypothetical protein
MQTRPLPEPRPACSSNASPERSGTKSEYQLRNQSTRPSSSGLLKASSGAAQESNLPSDGLRRLTGFEDRLGHRARAAPEPA